jgi:hypothetical protein
MGQGRAGGDPLGDHGQGLAKLAVEEMAGRGTGFGRPVERTVEHEDLPARQDLAQMIVGPAFAQADLEHRAG